MVDCGLHQGGHYADRENFEPFAYDPKEVTAVFITHSHLDHIGRLPSLVLAGFKGAIYSTHATRDFATLMLEDSEHLLAHPQLATMLGKRVLLVKGGGGRGLLESALAHRAMPPRRPRRRSDNTATPLSATIKRTMSSS